MSKTETVRARIEPGLKSKAEYVFRKLGLTPTQAIRLFYKQVELRNGLPFLALAARTIWSSIFGAPRLRFGRRRRTSPRTKRGWAR